MQRDCRVIPFLVSSLVFVLDNNNNNNNRIAIVIIIMYDKCVI